MMVQGLKNSEQATRFNLGMWRIRHDETARDLI